jgi:cephalosporin-C deacetylase-like acetyl esterase
LIAIGASPPVHYALTATSVVLYFMPGKFPQPLDMAGYSVKTIQFDYAGPNNRTIHSTVYVPESPGRHPGILLVHGWLPRGDRAPEVIRFGQALARAGHVVLVPRLEPLIAAVVEADDVRALVVGGQILKDRPEVDPNRLAVFGVCLGATMALAAAAQPDMPPLREATVINAYYDVVELLQGVTTQTAYVDGRLVPWKPGPQVEHVVKVNARVLSQQSAEAAKALDAVFANRDPSRVRALWEAVPPASRARLEVASPALWATRVHTNVVLLQAVSDPVVPPGSLTHYVKDLGAHAITAGGKPNPMMDHNDLGLPALNWSTFTGVYLPGGWQIGHLTYSAIAVLNS